MAVSGLFFCKIGAILAGYSFRFSEMSPCFGLPAVVWSGVGRGSAGLLACGAVCSRLSGLMYGSCPAMLPAGLAVWGKIKPRYYGGASLVVVFNYLILILFFPASILHKWRILHNA